MIIAVGNAALTNQPQLPRASVGNGFIGCFNTDQAEGNINGFFGKCRFHFHLAGQGNTAHLGGDGGSAFRNSSHDAVFYGGHVFIAAAPFDAVQQSFCRPFIQTGINVQRFFLTGFDGQFGLVQTQIDGVAVDGDRYVIIILIHKAQVKEAFTILQCDGGVAPLIQRYRFGSLSAQGIADLKGFAVFDLSTVQIHIEFAEILVAGFGWQDHLIGGFLQHQFRNGPVSLSPGRGQAFTAVNDGIAGRLREDLDNQRKEAFLCHALEANQRAGIVLQFVTTTLQLHQRIVAIIFSKITLFQFRCGNRDTSLFNLRCILGIIHTIKEHYRTISNDLNIGQAVKHDIIELTILVDRFHRSQVDDLRSRFSLFGFFLRKDLDIQTGKGHIVTRHKSKSNYYAVCLLKADTGLITVLGSHYGPLKCGFSYCYLCVIHDGKSYITSTECRHHHAHTSAKSVNERDVRQALHRGVIYAITYRSQFCQVDDHRLGLLCIDRHNAVEHGQQHRECQAQA